MLKNASSESWVRLAGMKPTDLQPEAVQQLLEPMLTTGARDAASWGRRLVCLPMAVSSL
jgi:hypothetical protein